MSLKREHSAHIILFLIDAGKVYELDHHIFYKLVPLSC